MIAASKIRTETNWEHVGRIYAERMKRAAQDQGSFTVAKPVRERAR